MWSWRRDETVLTASPALRPDQGDGGSSCPICDNRLAHCHGTLVLHADGVLECEEFACGADPGLHEWWMACTELESSCGCVGDERPLASMAEAA